jgi:hypothetical protein
MDERKTTSVLIFSDSLPSSLDETIVFLEGLFESIPKDCRQSATIEVEEDRTYPDVIVKYERPETDADMADRLRWEKIQQDGIRQQELAALARLKAKYEGN